MDETIENIFNSFHTLVKKIRDLSGRRQSQLIRSYRQQLAETALDAYNRNSSHQKKHLKRATVRNILYFFKE